MMARRPGSLLAALTAAGLFAAACSTSSEGSLHGREKGADCFVNSDCGELLVCAFQRCHIECITTRDCAGVERCAGASASKQVCQLEAEAACRTSADCGSGLDCGPDGVCRNGCDTSAQCIAEQTCVQNVCADARDLDDSGALPQTVAHVTCGRDSECPEGSRCAFGNCVPECREDADCDGGKTCQQGQCRYATAEPCAAVSDCPLAGAECVDGQCRCACLTDVDCAAGQRCDGCACVAGPEPECSEASPCAPGSRCIEGACDCECVTNRDCDAPLVCDGCSCARPNTISDARVDSQLDIDELQGISVVEGRLELGGAIASIAGLEGLREVGSLEIEYTSLGSIPGEAPLAGLSGLKKIRGDLTIANNGYLVSLAFDAGLTVEGSVSIADNYLLSTCAILDFQARLNAQQPPLGFSHTGSEVACAGQCEGALCLEP
jgi:hypothetical protein